MSDLQKGTIAEEIAIELDPSRLSWPSPRDAEDDSGLGGNRQYFDLRGVGWRDAAQMIKDEGALLVRLSSASDLAEEARAIEEEAEEELEKGDFHILWGLDVGVAAAVISLAAAGCVPFASCNGGVFGEGRHHELYPLVAFYMRARIAEQISVAAEESGAGLYMGDRGTLQVYASSPWTLHEFAKRVFDRRSLIRQAHRIGSLRKAKTPKAVKQTAFL